MATTHIEGLKNHHCSQVGIIFGNGPSLWNFAPEKLPPYEKAIRIGLNRSFEWGSCDYYVAIDPPWIQAFNSGQVRPRHCLICPNYRAKRLKVSPDLVCLVDMMPKVPFGHTDQWRTNIMIGGWPYNTGLFALQATIHMGCKEIYLLGFDGGKDIQWQNKYHIRASKEMPQDVKVFNCNPETQIPGWPVKEMPEWTK